jgi:uncharacterized protein with HEPN domain
MRGDRLRLLDILDAINVIQAATPNSRAEFDANPAVKSHVLLQAMIIGEAASKI